MADLREKFTMWTVGATTFDVHQNSALWLVLLDTGWLSPFVKVTVLWSCELRMPYDYLTGTLFLSFFLGWRPQCPHLSSTNVSSFSSLDSAGKAPVLPPAAGKPRRVCFWVLWFLSTPRAEFFGYENPLRSLGTPPNYRRLVEKACWGKNISCKQQNWRKIASATNVLINKLEKYCKKKSNRYVKVENWLLSRLRAVNPCCVFMDLCFVLCLFCLSTRVRVCP